MDAACDILTALQAVEPVLFGVYSEPYYTTASRCVCGSVAGVGSGTNEEYARVYGLVMGHLCNGTDDALELPPPIMTHPAFSRIRELTGKDPTYGQVFNEWFQWFLSTGAAASDTATVSRAVGRDKHRGSDVTFARTELEVLDIIKGIPMQHGLLLPTATHRQVVLGAAVLRAVLSRLRASAFPGSSTHWLHRITHDRLLAYVFSFMRTPTATLKRVELSFELFKDAPTLDLYTVFEELSLALVTDLNMANMSIVDRTWTASTCFKFENLKLLMLRGCINVDDACLHCIAEACPNLLSLDVSGCDKVRLYSICVARLFSV